MRSVPLSVGAGEHLGSVQRVTAMTEDTRHGASVTYVRRTVPDRSHLTVTTSHTHTSKLINSVGLGLVRDVAVLLTAAHPLPSNRHHPSSGDCLEGKGENYLFCAILCATIVHSVMHTHMNRLTVLWIGFCLTGPISLC